MADIQIVDSNGKVVSEEKSSPLVAPEPPESLVLPEIVTRAVGTALGLDKESEYGLYQDKLNTLIDYVKSQTQDLSPENVKWVIRSLELKLGTPPFSEKRINYVARYAYLLSEEKRIQDEKMKFEQA